MYIAHEDNKDKEFELEMTWVSSMSGPTKGRHEEVPKELQEEAERLAKKELEGEDDEMEDEAAKEAGTAGDQVPGDRMEE